MFKTSESGGKGQLLDGDPSFVTNDAALVKNLKLNYKVVYAGCEAALIQTFRQAEQNKKPVIGYFYEPQWFLSEVPLVKVNLPPYKEGCDADPAKVACDYPLYDLNKIVSTKFAESGSPAYDAGQELHLDQRRPEPGRQVHRRGQDDAPRRPPRSGSTPTPTRSRPGCPDPLTHPLVPAPGAARLPAAGAPPYGAVRPVPRTVPDLLTPSGRSDTIVAKNALRCVQVRRWRCGMTGPRVVIIGAGVVGAALADELTARGWDRRHGRRPGRPARHRAAPPRTPPAWCSRPTAPRP